MFLIASEDVPNADMYFNSDFVAFQSKFNKKTQSITSFLIKDSKHIHAIALWYKSSYSFPEIALTSKTPSMVINEKLQETIKTNLIDFVVYARKQPYDNCHIFANLYHDYSKKEYILESKFNY